MAAADLLADLVRAGVSVELVARVAEEIAMARVASSAKPQQTPGARRQAAYRARLHNGVTPSDGSDVTRDGSDGSDVTGDVTPSVTGDVTPPPYDRSNPPGTSLRSERERAGREAAPEFRQAYPRRPGAKWQQATEKFIRLVRDGTPASEILDGTRRFADFRAGEDPKYTPDPLVFLNQRRWLDDFDKPPPTQPPRAGPPHRPVKPSAVAAWTEDIFTDEQRHNASAETRRPALAYRG